MNVLNDQKSKTVLIVEDSNEDYETTVRALKQAGVDLDIHRCTDGDEALDYLFQRGVYTDADSAPRPAVILLDLNMPGTDGFEVIDTIKREAALKAIPVVVLTTSTNERDIQACYESGANSYIHKPVDLNAFIEAIKRFKAYWFETVILA